jgi:hypothetical protein
MLGAVELLLNVEIALNDEMLEDEFEPESELLAL